MVFWYETVQLVLTISRIVELYFLGCALGITIIIHLAVVAMYINLWYTLLINFRSV